MCRQEGKVFIFPSDALNFAGTSYTLPVSGYAENGAPPFGEPAERNPLHIDHNEDAYHLEYDAGGGEEYPDPEEIAEVSDTGHLDDALLVRAATDIRNILDDDAMGEDRGVLKRDVEMACHCDQPRSMRLELFTILLELSVSQTDRLRELLAAGVLGPKLELPSHAEMARALSQHYSDSGSLTCDLYEHISSLRTAGYGRGEVIIAYKDPIQEAGRLAAVAVEAAIRDGVAGSAEDHMHWYFEPQANVGG